MNEFNGTGLVIWFSDGKMKYRLHSDQDQFTKEVERIRNNIPPRAIATFAIDWDSESLIALVGESEDA